MRTRRDFLGAVAGVALAGGARFPAGAAAPDCPAPDAADGAIDGMIDRATAPLLSLLPDAAIRAGLPEASAGGPAARRCDDFSPDGRAALALAVAAARASLPAPGCAPQADVARALLDRAAASAALRYGVNDPLAPIHRPYAVTAFSGPHLESPATMAYWQDLSTPAAADAWLDRLEASAATLTGVAQSLRADEGAGCTPPTAVSRAPLPQMDRFILTAAERHPLTLALDRRLAAAGIDATVRAQATRKAAATLTRHVQPAMALLRDALAGLTRRGRSEAGLWAQPGGETLHAVNVARAGDTEMSLSDAQALGQAEAKRVAALLDRRLAARGLRAGTLASRVAAAFVAHPEFIQSDDEGGRVALLQEAQARLDAARAVMSQWMPAADVAPLAVMPLPGEDKALPPGSFYMPAAIHGGRGAVLWLDTRSLHALPAPGVAPIAFHLGLPGLHLMDSRAMAARSRIARMAAWPAIREGWGGYAERLAAEQGLFARLPWADIARLSDELLRAARLVVDIGIHAQRWTRAQAEAAMTEMTGAPQTAAIDRIVALPGEAASGTLGLHRLFGLRDRARAATGRRFDLRAFHEAILGPGPRPFPAIERDVTA